MFDTLFGDDEEDNGFTILDSGDVGHSKVRMRSMADEMELPPIPRDPGIFAGLKNQGATCYLNSLFQCIFFCPEMREFFYTLDLEKFTAYEKGSKAYNIIREFQLFFAKLKYMDFKNQTTETLTNAFGWGGGEGSQQQDVAEAMRVIFETLEKCFFESGKTEEFTKVFKGTTINYIKCLTCNYTSETSQPFYDLMLQIVNFGAANSKSVDESLKSMMAPELMDGNNKYFCDPCGEKRDAHRGMKMGQLPDVMIMSLCRFALDYTTWQRKKINDKYEFDLRMNMNQYTGVEEDQFYDLFGVIIHRGDAYGGHYHAIIRDTLEECENLKDFFEGIEQDDNKQINQDKRSRKWYEDDAKDLPEEYSDILRELFVLYNKPDTIIPEKEDEKSAVPEKKGKKKEDDCPDPFPTKVERTPETEYLFNNWYDFDDTRVKKFDVNKLHKYFGPSRETAYILFYRKSEQHAKKEHFKNLTPPPGIYEEVLNINQTKKQQKISYEKNKFKINLNVGRVEDIYDFEENDLIENRDSSKCFDICISKYDYIKDFKKQIRGLFGIGETEEFLMVMYEVSADNDTLDLTQIMTLYEGDDGWRQIQDCNIFHKTHWFVIKYNHPRISQLGERISIKNTKFSIKVKVGEETHELISPKFLSDDELIEQLNPLVDWNLNIRDINVISNQEFIPLLEVPKVERSMGIPSDGFTFVLKQKTYNPDTDKIIWPQDGSFNFVEEESSNLKTVLLSISETFEGEVPRDGPMKIAVDYTMPLGELLDIIKDRYEIPRENARRLRNLLDNRLFSRDDLEKSLIDLGYVEGGQRIRFERGRTPLTGGFDINVKYTIFDDGKKHTLTENFIVELNKKIKDYWPNICSTFNLDPEEHHLYEANWHGDPSSRIRHFDQTIEALGTRQGDNWVIMHNSMGVSQEMLDFEVHYSKSGLPGDQKKVGSVRIHQGKNMKNLINSVYNLSQEQKGDESMQDAPAQFKPENILLREMNKHEKYGRVLNSLNKSIKNNKVKVRNLVFSIENEKVEVNRNDLRLYVRKRLQEEDIYGPYQELLFKSDAKGIQKYTTQDLKDRIFDLEEISEEKRENLEIVLIRHHPNRYKWLIMSDFTDNLRKRPYFFKDGNTIGYCIHPRGERPKDDWQHKEDREYAAALAASGNNTSNLGRVNDSASFKISIED